MTEEPTPRLDRRQRKTRSALDAALLRLIADRPYPSITVEDIVTAADCARATFYAHYRDKDDLLAAAYQQLMDEFVRSLAQVSWRMPPVYNGSGAIAILRHVDDNRDLYRVLISGQGGPRAREVLINTYTDTAAAIFGPAATSQDKSPRLPLRFVATSFVGALLLVLEQWLNGQIVKDADSLAVDFMKSQAGGLEWALGFESGELQYVPARDSLVRSD